MNLLDLFDYFEGVYESISQGQSGASLGPVVGILRLHVLLQASMNWNLYSSKPRSIFQISVPPEITPKLFCIKNLQMDLSFQEKKMFAINYMVHKLQQLP